MTKRWRGSCGICTSMSGPTPTTTSRRAPVRPPPNLPQGTAGCGGGTAAPPSRAAASPPGGGQQGTGGSGTALPQPMAKGKSWRATPSSASIAFSASSRFCGGGDAAEEQGSQGRWGAGGGVAGAGTQRRGARGRPRPVLRPARPPPGCGSFDRRAVDPRHHPAPALGPRTMKDTKPVLRPRRRCSSSRGHMTLTEPMGPKRPNSRMSTWSSQEGGRAGGPSERAEPRRRRSAPLHRLPAPACCRRPRAHWLAGRLAGRLAGCLAARLPPAHLLIHVGRQVPQEQVGGEGVAAVVRAALRRQLLGRRRQPRLAPRLPLLLLPAAAARAGSAQRSAGRSEAEATDSAQVGGAAAAARVRASEPGKHVARLRPGQHPAAHRFRFSSSASMARGLPLAAPLPPPGSLNTGSCSLGAAAAAAAGAAPPSTAAAMPGGMKDGT